MNRSLTIFIVVFFWLATHPFFLYAMEICKEPEQTREIANALKICEQARQMYHESGQTDEEATALILKARAHWFTPQQD